MPKPYKRIVDARSDMTLSEGDLIYVDTEGTPWKSLEIQGPSTHYTYLCAVCGEPCRTITKGWPLEVYYVTHAASEAGGEAPPQSAEPWPSVGNCCPPCIDVAPSVASDGGATIVVRITRHLLTEL